MIQSSTQPNTIPATEPNKAPAQVGPEQSDAEKKAQADKAGAGNSNAKS